LSLAQLALTFGKLSMGAHRRRIWKHIAFVGRYGHQPVDVTLALPVADLRDLSSAVADLMGEEAPSLKGPGDG